MQAVSFHKTVVLIGFRTIFCNNFVPDASLEYIT